MELGEEVVVRINLDQVSFKHWQSPSCCSQQPNHWPPSTKTELLVMRARDKVNQLVDMVGNVAIGNWLMTC